MNNYRTTRRTENAFEKRRLPACVSLFVFFTVRRGTFPYSIEDDAYTTSQTPTTHYTNTWVKLTIVTHPSFSERIAIANLSLEDMFRALQAAGLTLEPSKIHFGPNEVHYLGHVLSADGIRIGEDQIKAIADLKTPSTIKELRSVLRTINFVRKFTPNLATIIDPLVALTRKSVVYLKMLRTTRGLNRTLPLSK